MNKESALEFYKFPRTKHLLDASVSKSNIARDDLIMDKHEMMDFLTNVITVEEKVDGANLGISMDQNYSFRVQNRAHFVTSCTHRQFSVLDSWLDNHSADLFKILSSSNHILFGEWLYARHSVYYTQLPDYFIAFGLYDRRRGAFASRKKLQDVLSGTSIPIVPLIETRRFKSVSEVTALLDTTSAYYDGPVEGLYLRVDGDSQDSTESQRQDVLLKFSKIVRPDFIQHIEEQWTKQTFIKNIVSYS